MAEFQVADNNTQYYCFSTDGRLVAVGATGAVFIWDITTSNPYLVETFIGHTENITFLTFSSPSSLISASEDKSVRFWQIGALLMDPAVVSPKSISPALAPIKSITLQAKDGIVITSDSSGVVKTWDISTGLCKASFQTSARGSDRRDVQLIDGRLIFVWCTHWEIYVWDVRKGKLLSEIGQPGYSKDLRISGDGSRVFSLGKHSICAWYIQTGEVANKVAIGYSETVGSLTMDGSKVWAYWPQSEYQGWDFQIPGSPPVQLSNMPMLCNGSVFWDPKQTRIKDAVTGKVVFQLSGRFAKPTDVQCDGSYLVAGYGSGEILILDLKHVLL